MMSNKNIVENNKTTLLDKAKSWYYSKSSADRKKIVKYGTIASFIIIIFGFYYASGKAETVNKPIPKTSVVADTAEDKLLKDDVVAQLQGDIKDSNAKITDDVAKKIQDMINKGEFKLAPTPPVNLAEANISPVKENNELGSTTGNPVEFSYPQPLSESSPVSSDNSTPVDGTTPPDAGPIWLGDIAIDNSAFTQPPAEVNTEKKNQIQLPVGFMKAHLLVGVNALTGEFGAENPQTVMFRVQAPAQLPNFIKMNLSGCFSVANVTGNLSMERIIALPISMHCITRDKRFIVEGSIKGFVSDRDGKRDMSARVVSRAGPLLASTIFAKSIEGFANVVGSQGVTQNVSALGSVNTIKNEDLAKTAATQGLAGGLSEVGKYLLDLAKQTAPALETGSGKDVMLFIQETATLEIKEVRIK
ncbi:TPA: TraB/VirB10 family protein [Yersinia enterocolitica]|nr:MULTISPECIES: TraB/VirB10 family protein [Yersinia]